MAGVRSKMPTWADINDDEDITRFSDSWYPYEGGASSVGPHTSPAEWVLYDHSRPLLGSGNMTPAPYVVGPTPGAGPHKEGDPVGVYLLSHAHMVAPELGTTHPIMVIDSRVHIMDPFYSTNPDARTEQLCFGAFSPAQPEEADVAIVPPNSPMQGTHSWDSLLDDILRGGDNIKQKSPEKDPQDCGSRPVFNIMANAASVHGASIMSDMRSSYMSTPESGAAVEVASAAGNMVFTAPAAPTESSLEQSTPATGSGERVAALVNEPPATDLAVIAAEEDGEEEEAAQQQLPQDPDEATAVVSSVLGSLASAALLAGCVAGAAVEEFLEAGPKAARVVLRQPQPADSSLGIRLFRQATRAGYVAAGHVIGAGDAAHAAVGALAACFL